MNSEAVLVAAVIMLAGLPLVAATFRTRRPVSIGIAALLLAATASIAWAVIAFRPPVDLDPPTDWPIEVDADGYVSSDTCRACHPHEYNTWHASYHRSMTQVASPKSVISNFDGVSFQYFGRTYQLEQIGDEYWVEMDDPGSAWGPEGIPRTGNAPSRRIRRQIVMTTGSHHMQVYWYPTEQGRLLGQFPFTYLKKERRWIPRSAAFLHPPSGDSTETGRWNTVCIKCHTTHGMPRITNQNEVDTHVGEFGISCQACHGPAQEHIRANRDPQRRYEYHLNAKTDPTIVMPTRLSPRLEAQICGQCHAINEFQTQEEQALWHSRGYRYRPGDDLAETQLTMVKRNWSLPRPAEIIQAFPHFIEQKFWADGMVRVSGREYNGLIDSPCYTHGDPGRGIMTCSSCHQMHMSADDPRQISEWADDQLANEMVANQACLQCHGDFAGDDVVAAHTHHKPNSTGSLCYNCHMPHTTYGLLKAMRSHTVSSPSVDESLETGRPNACNACHMDRTLAWTARSLEKWHGIPQPELSDDERTIAASILWALRGDAGQRALIAWSMGWKDATAVSGTDWLAPYLAQLMLDPYEAVRYIGYRSLRRLEGYETYPYDFVGSPEHRMDAAKRVVAIWTGQNDPDRSTGGALLIDSQGQMDRDTFSRLLKDRDYRIVDLTE